jgi:hypothetical protein
MINTIRNFLVFIWDFLTSLLIKCWSEEDSREKREEMVRQELNDWQVDMYSQNKYLHRIPESRIRQKRNELKRKHSVS